MMSVYEHRKIILKGHMSHVHYQHKHFAKGTCPICIIGKHEAHLGMFSFS